MSLMRRPGERAQMATHIAAMVKDRFGLNQSDAVIVSEVSCPTPGCPPIETCVLFWKGDATRYRLKFFKPMKEVIAEDLPPSWMLPGLEDEAEGCC